MKKIGRVIDKHNCTDENSDVLHNRVVKEILNVTNVGVRDLQVVNEDDSVVIHGRCHTFYTKQLAQQIAVSILGNNTEIVNAIDVT
ncbi:MAG: hypothetical protein LBU65_04880 [Planctomycetaceae bacterium]|jgi:hypothetical protein|nr:hypothetical protein [Planctomycetaceae bacterium]